MKTFEFSLIASGLDPEAADFADRFFVAGCDDATISFQKGHVILDFARSANSLQDAIASAIADVQKAGATVDRVEPDPLVSLNEIAARTGLSRAAMTHYSKGKRGKNFPAPIARVTSSSPLWDWSIVARWMYENEKINIEAAVGAETFKLANEVLCRGQIPQSDELKRRADEYSAELQAA